MALTKVDISMLEDAGATGQVLTSDGTNWTSAVAAGGDTRNFIIDGDFTQWPEGTTVTAVSGSNYGPALWNFPTSTTSAVYDAKRGTDVPTVAQSSHSSSYSFDVDCTTADASVAANDWHGIQFNMTGSDFAFLDQQQVTLAFWIKATKTGTSCVYFTNSAYNRAYVSEFTISTTNTWEYKTVTVTLDTTGTWLYTEADVGLRVGFPTIAGSTYHATADTWSAGNKIATTNQVNHADNTSNIFRIAQVGLYLGSSAPTFLGEPITTVKDQVEWYVERWQLDNVIYETLIMAQAENTSRIQCCPFYHKKKRVIPACTSSGGGFRATDGNVAVDLDTSALFQSIGRFACGFKISQSGTTFTAGRAALIYRDSTDVCFFMFDSRH